MCVSTHSYVCHVSFICVSWLIHTCVVTHRSSTTRRLWHTSTTHMNDLIHICVITHLYVCYDSQELNCMGHASCLYVWYDSSMCVMTRSHVSWLTGSPLHVWHDSFMCVVTYSYVWHDSFICVSWLIHMTHSYVCRDSFICVSWLIHMCVVTHRSSTTRRLRALSSCVLTRCRGTVCCIVLHCVAVCCSVLQMRCSVLQCVAVCCNVLQCVAACCSVLQYVSVSCIVLQQCVAVCVQCVAAGFWKYLPAHMPLLRVSRLWAKRRFSNFSKISSLLNFPPPRTLKFWEFFFF